MKLYLLFVSLFLNCVNLDELKNAEPIHYLSGLIIASARGTQTSNSDQASFQIQGTLKDSSGNPIANATLTLGVSQNIVSREAVTTSTRTDANGNYTLNLKLGNFSVKVTNSSGLEIGSFRMNATSTTTKPEISVTSGNMSLVVSTVTAPSSISLVTVAPSNLSYSSNTLNLTVGTAMTSISPTVTGTVTSYSVSPALPSGLSLNSSTGVISGTPTSVQSAISYVITASNTGGGSTYQITISTSSKQINPSPPSNLIYPSSFLTVNVGSSVSLSPTVTGIVSSYSISPTTLPNGLNFNINSGLLSGIPSSVTSLSTYTISAINSGGSSQFTLNILIEPKVTVSLDNIIWQKCTIGLSGDNCNDGTAIKINWASASEECNNLVLGGRSDWRLPTLEELRSLVVYNISPTIDLNNLPSTQSDFYWTSTIVTYYAYVVNFSNGNQDRDFRIIYYSNNPQYYVRCVTGK